MKVLLVRPSLNKRTTTVRNFMFGEPIGIECVSTILKELKHNVLLVDLLVEKERKFIKYLKDFRPDVVGFTSQCTDIDNILYLASKVKDFDKNIKVIVGGIQATISPEAYFNKNIDYIKAENCEVTKQNENTIYTLKDQYGNTYIFKENSIMNYTVILDDYNLENEEFNKYLDEFFVEYYCVDGNSQDIARGIMIDGEYPFDEAKNVFFQRSFIDSAKPKTNNLGDEVMPSQVEVKEWKTTAIYDNGGMYGEPLKFALTAGEHQLTLVFINQPVLISKITIKSAKNLPSYKQVKAEYKEKGYKNVKDSVRFEAESFDNILNKSASSILIASDSDATMTPLAITSRKYNGIGGGTWNSGGDSITWKFEVKKAGLYKLALRSVQNANKNIQKTALLCDLMLKTFFINCVSIIFFLRF